MKQIAVSVHNVSKKFRLFNSPSERLFEALHPFNKKYHKEFWALKNINFEIEKGKTVGIIGRNGSGKSTLLQIICSILRPSSGEVMVNGRISALLELGAGFNPEFTGRQNVLMKGMLMGFSTAEMKSRLPEIEAFADIGEFIDQPVKIYSSGMFVRLAFATAINVDPDILIVDEALAVGDAKFQHKCYGKFLEFQKAGKTIILVTHDPDAIVRRCDSAILLERGEVLEIGVPKAIVNDYTDLLFNGKISNEEVKQVVSQVKTEDKDQDSGQIRITELDKFLAEVPAVDNCVHRKSYNKNEHRHGDRRAEIIDFLIVCENRFEPAWIYSDEQMDIYLKVRFNTAMEKPMVGLSIKTIDGVMVYAINTRHSKTYIAPATFPIIVVFKYSVKPKLISGDFFIDIGIAEKLSDRDEPSDIRKAAVHVIVKSKNTFEGMAEFETAFSEISRQQIRA